MCIRNSAKALIVNNGRILVNKCLNSTGHSIGDIEINEVYYDLPGGGQNKYETIEEAIKRECLEETGYCVSANRLVALYEEIYMDAQLRKNYPNYVHKIYFVFLCNVLDKRIESIKNKDIDQIESQWIDIKDIPNISLYPKSLKSNIQLMLKTQGPIFLGSYHI